MTSILFFGVIAGLFSSSGAQYLMNRLELISSERAHGLIFQYSITSAFFLGISAVLSKTIRRYGRIQKLISNENIGDLKLKLGQDPEVNADLKKYLQAERDELASLISVYASKDIFQTINDIRSKSYDLEGSALRTMQSELPLLEILAKKKSPVRFLVQSISAYSISPYFFSLVLGMVCALDLSERRDVPHFAFGCGLLFISIFLPTWLVSRFSPVNSRARLYLTLLMLHISILGVIFSYSLSTSNPATGASGFVKICLIAYLTYFVFILGHIGHVTALEKEILTNMEIELIDVRTLRVVVSKTELVFLKILLAGILHKRVQSLLLIEAKGLPKGARHLPQDRLESVLMQVDEIFDMNLMKGNAQVKSSQEAFAQILRPWKNLMEVDIDTSRCPVGSGSNIKEDPRVTSMLEDVLLNAHKHGKASKVSVSIIYQDDKVKIRAENDGMPILEAIPGLGFLNYNRTAQGKWSITNFEGGVVFEAILTSVKE